MKRVVISLVMILAFSGVANAQDDEGLRRVGWTKVIVGAGLTGTGALIAATARQSAELGTLGKISSNNNTQLVIGLAMAAGGVYFLIDGKKDLDESRGPQSYIGFGPRGISFTRSW